MKLPFEEINGGQIGFDSIEAMEEELARCGWTPEEYLLERDRRIAEGIIR